jgi:hypothetical protein
MPFLVPIELVVRERQWRRCVHGCGLFCGAFCFVVLRTPAPIVDFFLCRACWVRFGRDRLFSKEVLRCRNG